MRDSSANPFARNEPKIVTDSPTRSFYGGKRHKKVLTKLNSFDWGDFSNYI